mmetsp:Transcript_1963/g.3470  ORF Transcript_1963/g.3470 Transcript_1963/m.3470 type:complete len:94 (+) Transcript_1963:373-654(+)
MRHPSEGVQDSCFGTGKTKTYNLVGGILWKETSQEGQGSLCSVSDQECAVFCGKHCIFNITWIFYSYMLFVEKKRNVSQLHASFWLSTRVVEC